MRTRAGRASRGSTAGVALAAIAALALAGGCKRSTSAPATQDAAPAPLAPNAAAPNPGAVPGAPATTAAGADPMAAPEQHEIAPSDYPQPLLPGAAEPSPTAPGAAAAPTANDPFESAIADAKSQAVGCFAPLPPGSYAVAVSAYVTPAGRAARAATVSASVTDESVLACIRGIVEAKRWPESAGGRSVGIDVAVVGK